MEQMILDNESSSTCTCQDFINTVLIPLKELGYVDVIQLKNDNGVVIAWGMETKNGTVIIYGDTNQPLPDKIRLSSINWLKDTTNADVVDLIVSWGGDLDAM